MEEGMEDKKDSNMIPMAIELQPPGLTAVKLSAVDKAVKIRIEREMTAIGEKGHRMVRATHGLSQGELFYEMRFNPSHRRISYKSSSRERGESGNAPDLPPHIRVGWCTDRGDLEGPCGFDRFSYSYRDVDGQVFHQSVGQHYGNGFGVGDVIGCYIYLPSDEETIAAAQKTLSSPTPKETKTLKNIVKI